mmetsp:Transcript_105780/g.315961  ORF Transcript_105780/g.315961 Transcript_105780/m.315961 type:complete len:202 (+) Transcript_105780:366-971(+)
MRLQCRALPHQLAAELGHLRLPGLLLRRKLRLRRGLPRDRRDGGKPLRLALHPPRLGRQVWEGRGLRRGWPEVERSPRLDQRTVRTRRHLHRHRRPLRGHRGLPRRRPGQPDGHGGHPRAGWAAVRPAPQHRRLRRQHDEVGRGRWPRHVRTDGRPACRHDAHCQFLAVQGHALDGWQGQRHTGPLHEGPCEALPKDGADV